MLEWINDILDSDPPPDRVSLIPNGVHRSLVQLLHDCESLYRSAAQRILRYSPESVQGRSEQFPTLMADLHRGVVLKTLVEIAHCDRRWSMPEREAATIVLRHAWGSQVASEDLSKALARLVKQSSKLQWTDLFGPFLRVDILRREAEELRSIILRLASVIAKADGQVLDTEQMCLRELSQELDKLFAPVTSPQGSQPSNAAGAQVAAELAHPPTSRNSSGSTGGDASQQVPSADHPDTIDREQLFTEALKELDGLVGLDVIKHDIRQLVDFLRVQSMRQEHNLPSAQISLHAVFEGNPGTGKTTVARIIARLLCGLKILEQGQTVETDRSGLVAPYAGQTGPRTHQKIDEALGGVLFIDEAYSLVAERGDDSFGIEALQALLKRMEDDRDRFVTILAGYPQPMDRMLRTNPGLKSRIQKSYTFPDYSAKDLLRIFYGFCREYHYRLPKQTRIKLLRGFQQAIESKDEHFGNGRLARNLFETSIRHMSSRVVNSTPLTRELLTTILPEDIRFQ